MNKIDKTPALTELIFQTGRHTLKGMQKINKVITIELCVMKTVSKRMR